MVQKDITLDLCCKPVQRTPVHFIECKGIVMKCRKTIMHVFYCLLSISFKYGTNVIQEAI